MSRHIVDDEQRRDRPQPPCALRVPDAAYFYHGLLGKNSAEGIQKSRFLGGKNSPKIDEKPPFIDAGDYGWILQAQLQLGGMGRAFVRREGNQDSTEG